MSDEAAFLRAMAAAPDDATARLAFADLLEEGGDFRGAFVRTALAFAHTPPHDPERFALADQLRALLDSPPFKKWLPKTDALKWGWRRGLLRLSADTAKLEGAYAEPLAEWLASNWIERVSFDGYTSQPEWDFTFGLLSNARELHFGTDNYGPGVLDRLREWPHLRALSISYLMRPWAELAALPHLRNLTLRNPDWTMMPELHEARLPDLEALSINKEWNDDLPHWGTCFPKLRSLSLSQYNSFDDQQCGRFAECPLRHLALHERYQPFKRTGLLELANMTGLRSLTLGRWPRGTVEVLAKLPHLEHLGGSDNTSAIRGLEGLPALRRLSLTECRFTKSLAGQVARLPRLSRLDVWFESIEDGAVAALAKAPALRVLTLAVLNAVPAVSELARLEGLQYLRISPPGLPPQDLDEVRKALPGCRVVNGEWAREDDDYEW